MSDRKFIIPEYGPFAGMRVITSGSLIAMPFAATMLADFGAEVIHLERPGVGDTLRMLAPFAEVNGKKVSTAWAQDARNKLSLSLELNLKHPEVKELFYGLIKESDIYMENMVWLDKLGIHDEDLLEVNPKLVIVHISGLGNAKFGGLPNVCNRASYDMIGQAFSGWLYLQGFKDRDPVVAKPYMNDFVSAFAALFGTLAAYTTAQKTGKGQVVDVAQFEAMAQYMCGTYTSYTMTGQVSERSGNASPAFQPYDLFESKDGALVALGAFGPGVYSAASRPSASTSSTSTTRTAPPAWSRRQPEGPRAERQGRRVVQEPHCGRDRADYGGRQVPCSKVNNAKDTFENEHFKSRGDWITYEDQTVGADITAFGIAPKLSETPARSGAAPRAWPGHGVRPQDRPRLRRRQDCRPAREEAHLNLTRLIRPSLAKRDGRPQMCNCHEFDEISANEHKRTPYEHCIA